MSNETAPSRAWTFPTSPRSPHKIKPELELLSQLVDKTWTRASGQAEFSRLLSDSGEFEGEGSKKDPTFSARDRTRAPKQLGLIEVNKVSKIPVLSITAAGQELLKLSDGEEPFFFLNQIAKVQYPSLQHNTGCYAEMNCRPLTIAIVILQSVGSITKEEFGLFINTCTHFDDVDAAIAGIKNFRNRLRKSKPGLLKKLLRRELREERAREVYATDLASGSTGLREGGKNFIKTKLDTLNDYADASIRYLLSTGIFVIDGEGKTFSINSSKADLATQIVEDLGLDSSYKAETSKTYITDYLGNPAQPELSIYDVSLQLKRIAAHLKGTAKPEVDRSKNELAMMPHGFQRETLIERCRKDIKQAQHAAQSQQLAHDRALMGPEIDKVFDSIVDRNSDLLDRPLYFEWNTWRAFAALNDCIVANGNFRSDADGNLLGTATGKVPDIVIEYADFWLAVEVTLSNGLRQYESESESIVRHVGQLQATRVAEGDSRPVFGMFIAPNIQSSVTAHLLTVARYTQIVYAGPVKIVPVSLRDFREFFLKNCGPEAPSSSVLLQWIRGLFSTVKNISFTEIDWSNQIRSTLKQLSLT